MKKFLIKLIPIRSIRKKLRQKYKYDNNPILFKLYKNNKIDLSAELNFYENIESESAYIGRECRIYAEGGLKIGKGTAIAEGVFILTTNHNYKSNKDIPMDNIGFLMKTEIGKNCWIGARSMLCPGIKIEDGVVVAMGSVVTKSVPKCAIVGGNPAKIIGYRDKDLYDKLVVEIEQNPRKSLPVEWIRKEGFKNYLE